jgi:predicted DNA-binding protein
MERGMKQILLELDDDTAARLDAAAPPRSRKRSEFIRSAIRRALWELEEQATEAAYRLRPDTEPAYFDASAWGVREPEAAPRAKPRRRPKP